MKLGFHNANEIQLVRTSYGQCYNHCELVRNQSCGGKGELESWIWTLKLGVGLA